MAKIETIQQVFDLVPRYFRPEAAKGVRVDLQFDIDGPGGGTWWVRINDGQIEVHNQPAPEKPDLYVHMSEDDFWALLRGELDPLWAYMRGRLRVKGNIQLVFRLQRLFRMPEPELLNEIRKKDNK